MSKKESKRKRLGDKTVRAKRGKRAAPGFVRARKSKSAEDARTSGHVFLTDYAKRGGRSGVVVGTTGPKGGIGGMTPGEIIAWRIRRAFLPARRVETCYVYDAQGKLVATIDPQTRKRNEVNSGKSQVKN